LRLLIDENLSPRLARWACDQIVVTVNVGDFLRLAASMEVHPGVIALREAGLSAEQQWLRVQSALQLIQHDRDTGLINRVLDKATRTM
jgi:predicted nuclease of predicted toxin-antitoxin system